MPRAVAVGNADDPYKKYWWAILAGFGLTGAWLCLPMMETSVGSTHIDAAKPVADASLDQSLDAAVNPSGAPGDALNLSMDGTYRKKKTGENITSMLYQASEDPKAAAGSLAASAGSASSSASLAKALKAVGDKKDSSWGGEKAQRGFSSPKLAGGSISGLGGSAAGSSASAGSGAGAFGSHVANVGYSSTRGLRDDGGADSSKSGGIAALKQGAKLAVNAASQSSADAASSGLSRAFDGSKKQNAISAGGKSGADAGLYSSLDAAPVNMKVNDPDIAKKEFKEPPTAEVAQSSADDNSQLMKQLAMAGVTAFIGGMIPGVGGQVAAAMMGVMAQRDKSNQQSVDEHKRRNG